MSTLSYRATISYTTSHGSIDYYNMDWKLMTSHFYLLAITRYRVRVFFPNLEHLSIEFFGIFFLTIIDFNKIIAN